MLFGTNEDDSDFNLFAGGGGSSKLANLFSSGLTQVPESNQSLTYTPPKQPKKSDSQSAQSVLHAVAVTAYKYDGGQYANQGKVGAAILGSHDPPMYKIILYRSKQQQLTTAMITSNFAFTVQANNYANFYDDQHVNWSLLFDTEQASSDFARQICFSKANSAGTSLTSPVVQDLNFGEGDELENGDSVELKYTGWIMTNHTYGQMFDTNENADKLFRIKLGKGKAVKGMEEGLLGAKKNSKRVIIIPPSLGYGSQGVTNKIPPNSILIFEVFVNKVKLARDSSRSSTPVIHEVDSGSGSDTKRKDTVPRSHTQSTSNEDSIRARGASISEQLSQSPKSEKAKIISRMAKMGMSLLPKQSGPGQPSSESETEEESHSKARDSPVPSQESQSREQQSPKPVPKPRSASNVSVSQLPVQTTPTMTAPQQMSVIQPQQYLPSNIYPFPYQSATTAPFSLLQQPFPNHAVATASPTMMTSIADTHLPLLLSETRSQNTEVRLALGKISEKVDSVLHKIDDVKTQSSLSVQIPYLESSVLLQNIQRIIQENTRLKQEIDEKSAKIQTLNEKICDLLHRNQKFIEESNTMLEKRSDSLHSTASQSHARLLALEQERVKLTTELAETISKLTSLQLELSTRQQQEAELRNQLQILTNNMQKQKDETETHKLKTLEQENLISTLEQNLKDTRQQRKDLESKFENMEEMMSDLKSAKTVLEKSLSDRKQQIQEERHKTANEMEEMKSEHEKEIEVLRNKLFRQRTMPSSEQISQIEEDIESKWKKQSEQMVSDAVEKYQKEINSLKEEKEEIEYKLKEVENNLERARTTHHSEADRIFKLEEEIEQLKQWKSKYEILYTNASVMKRQFEEQIVELTRQIRQGDSGFISSAFSSELKTAMNRLYKCLQNEFQSEETYSGSTVRQIALNTIREVTFELIEAKQPIVKGPDETDVQKDENQIEQQAAKVEEQTEVADDNETSTLHTEEEKPSSSVPSSEAINKSQTDSLSEDNKTNVHDDVQVESSVSGHVETLTNSDNVAETPTCTTDENQKMDRLSETNILDDKNEVSGKESSHVEEKQSNKNNEEITVEKKQKEDSTDTTKTLPSASPDHSDSGEDSSKQYLFFDNKCKSWKPQPPPPPLFDDDDEDEDDWLK